jgi:hypothetical protein
MFTRTSGSFENYATAKVGVKAQFGSNVALRRWPLLFLYIFTARKGLLQETIGCSCSKVVEHFVYSRQYNTL